MPTIEDFNNCDDEHDSENKVKPNGMNNDIH